MATEAAKDELAGAQQHSPESHELLGEERPEGAQSTSRETRVTCSRGFSSWLINQNCSLVFSSYQTGRLFFVGVTPERKLSFYQRQFTRAMGIAASSERIFLASLIQVWRLENVLRPRQQTKNGFDRVFVPRNCQVTGDLDVHEIGVLASGEPIFVNTLYSCLATFSRTHSFKPVWQPQFISRLAAEDRCHLNGLAMENGAPRYVTAVCRSDIVTGWRDRRAEGGCIIDVTTNQVLTEQLSMPHSPRVQSGQLWVLDSGRGYVARIDRSTGKREDVTFCPGFLRGLAFTGKYAVVGLSLPRDGAFAGLELDSELKKRDAEPRCGLNIIDLDSGDIVHWLRLDGRIKETFDVAVLPGARCPMALGLASAEIRTHITVEGKDVPAPGADRPMPQNIADNEMSSSHP